MTDQGSWALLGEAVVGFSSRPRRLVGLPRGIHRMPGPAVILAEKFLDSPVGPYLSLSIGEPARIGAHVGIYFGTSVVDNSHARRAGRQYWGYPHELGALRWISEGAQRGIAWDERGIEVRAEVLGRPMPFLVPVRTMQRRSDGPVVIPGRMRAMARRSRVSFASPEDDPFAVINGFHRGVALSGLIVRRNGARRPLGLFSTLNVPHRAPEPGVIGMKFQAAKVSMPSGV